MDALPSTLTAVAEQLSPLNEQWNLSYSFLVANMAIIRAAVWFGRLKGLADQINPRSNSRKTEELHQKSWPNVIICLKPSLENISYLQAKIWATKW